MWPIRYTEMQKNWSCTQGSLWPLEPCPHVWAVSQLRSLLEMQNIGPFSKPRNQDLRFNKIPVMHVHLPVQEILIWWILFS